MQRIVWLAIGSLGFLLHASLASAAARPNIVVVLVDDMGWSDIGCYGSEIPTPHLDALTQQSTVFEHHYTICPLCVPTRSSMMTGLYPRQHGAIINGWFPEEREHGTVKAELDLVPNRISAKGYDVYHAGIQHVRTSGGFEANCPDVKFIGPSSVGSHHRQLHKKGLMLPDMTVFRDPVLEHAGYGIYYRGNIYSSCEKIWCACVTRVRVHNATVCGCVVCYGHVVVFFVPQARTCSAKPI